MILFSLSLRDGVSLKTPRPRGWVRAGRPSGGKSSFNKRNMYQYPHVSQLFILLPWQSRVYLEPLKLVEFVQLTTECCWGQPSDPCQRGCLTSHACVMWGPRTLNADDDDDDDVIVHRQAATMFKEGMTIEIKYVRRQVLLLFYFKYIIRVEITDIISIKKNDRCAKLLEW